MKYSVWYSVVLSNLAREHNESLRRVPAVSGDQTEDCRYPCRERRRNRADSQTRVEVGSVSVALLSYREAGLLTSGEAVREVRRIGALGA
jgi:hypothetical protein